MIYVCFFDNSKLNLRRIKKTILFLRQFQFLLIPNSPNAIRRFPAVYADRFGFIIQTTAARLSCLSTQQKNLSVAERFFITNDSCRNYFSEAAAAASFAF